MSDIRLVRTLLIVPGRDETAELCSARSPSTHPPATFASVTDCTAAFAIDFGAVTLRTRVNLE